ncbi:MAG: formamidopyrimidine-DNA glycosylase [Pseudohongiellaceae bacterium]
MPELPEVETTRSGIEPHIAQQIVTSVVIRQARLRWPIPETLSTDLPGQTIREVRRRGKYLLLETQRGTLIIHLGMSGSLRILETDKPPQKHDHVDIGFGSGVILRYTDPRRFGCLLWETNDLADHPLLANLGPEPLEPEFDTEYLFKLSRRRKAAVKMFVMDSHVVVGVGNIYANEALFMAGINPKRQAGSVSKKRYSLLVDAIKTVLANAIQVGGTTLRDFTGSSGNPGYFKQSLNVYGRGKMTCVSCSNELKEIRLGQRTTVYCPKCQT